MFKLTKLARPIDVSRATEIFDYNGFDTGKMRVIVKFHGRCVQRSLDDCVDYRIPSVHGGIIYYTNYNIEEDFSIVEYHFYDGIFKNRVQKSEKFRNKMLAQIEKYKNKKAVINGKNYCK